MRILRAILRLVAILITTVLFAFILLFGYLIMRSLNTTRDFWRNRVTHLWAKCLLLILNVHLKTDGHRPTPPFFLVSNHVSYLDVLLFFSTLDCTFVAREDVRNWPLIGHLTRVTDIIFIDRKRKRDLLKINFQISEGVNSNMGVVLFPEGTTSDGSKIMPLNSPLLNYPAETGMAVNYATLAYKTLPIDPPSEMSVGWWGDISFTSHAWGLLKLRRIDAVVVFGIETITASDRKALSAELHSHMSQQFKSMGK